jgi:hypothetical protein
MFVEIATHRYLTSLNSSSRSSRDTEATSSVQTWSTLTRRSPKGTGFLVGIKIWVKQGGDDEPLTMALGDRSSARTHALTLHDEFPSLKEAADTVQMGTVEVVSNTAAMVGNNMFWLAE